jgi:hypothetical protein
VANRGKGSHRSRSRKRRPAAAPAATAVQEGSAVAESGAVPQATAAQRTDRRAALRAHDRARTRGGLGSRPAGERPHPPWHPWPLSELLIFLGAIAIVVGLSRKGLAHAGPPLIAGLGAVAVGTFEVTLREHLGGYRSHTLLLALLPVIAFHSAVVLVTAAFTHVPKALNIGLLAVDVALFALLFKVLRARYLDARARAGSR